jgi:TRAP-type C4-dicarboxylate transport system permease small subunit
VVGSFNHDCLKVSTGGEDLSKFFNKLIDFLCDKALVIDGFFILLMGAIMSYASIMRYAFHQPVASAYDLVMMLLVLSAIFAFPAVERQRRNIRMDLIINSLPRKIAVIIADLISPVFGIYYCFFLIWKGFVAGFYSASISETTGSVIDFPIAWLKILIPLAFCLLFLVLVAEFIRGIVSLNRQRAGLGLGPHPDILNINAKETDKGV